MATAGSRRLFERHRPAADRRTVPCPGIRSDSPNVTHGESGAFPWTHDARARLPFSGRPAAGA